MDHTDVISRELDQRRPQRGESLEAKLAKKNRKIAVPFKEYV